MNAADVYGNKIRIRSCGICTNEDGILMINHLGLGQRDFWSPPGGGINFGETAENCLVREFKEETNLAIEVGEFLFACEFVRDPLHAIELYFSIRSYSGELNLGTDPEVGLGKQFIKSLLFMPWREIKSLSPQSVHGIFNILDDSSQIKNLSGYFKV